MKLTINVFSGVGYGGANNLIFGLSEYLLSKGHNVKLYLIFPSFERNNSFLKKKIRKIGKSNVHVFLIEEFHKFGIIGNYITLFRLYKLHKKVALIINKSKPDLVIATHCRYTQSPFIIWFIKKLPLLYLFCETKREFYEKTSFDHYSLRRRIFRMISYPTKVLDKWNLRRIRKLQKYRIISISKNSQKQLQELYKLKSEVVYPGIRVGIFGGEKRRIGKFLAESFFLSVGALNFHKGYDFLIRSISLLPKNFRRLVLAGNGGYDIDNLKKIAGELDVRLEIRDSISDKELSDLYNSTALFLYAPRNEPFGLALFEAISSGAPIITVGEGGYAEIIRGKPSEIFLVRRNERLFAQKIREFFEDPNKYQKGLVTLRNISESLTWDNVGPKFEDVIKKLLT